MVLGVVLAATVRPGTAPEAMLPKADHPAAALGGATRLHHVAYLGDADAVRAICLAGEHVDAEDSDRRSPLLWAAKLSLCIDLHFRLASN